MTAQPPPRPSSQITGNIGLYGCCYGCPASAGMPTARNARGADLIAYSEHASRFVGIQIKALSKRAPVPLGASLNNIMEDFWIIVNKVASDATSAFVLLRTKVRERAHRGEKDGRVSFWLQPRQYEQGAFADAWQRIGHGGLPE